LQIRQHEYYVTVTSLLICYQISVKHKKLFLVNADKTFKNLKVAALNFT